jgi:hypothetical protein
MRLVFPDLIRIETMTPGKYTDRKTLWIEPTIQELKFVTRSARFWVGAMAGNSYIKMNVFYRNVSNNESNDEVIADPVFFETAPAYGGAYSVGETDRQMLDRVAESICSYTALSR